MTDRQLHFWLSVKPNLETITADATQFLRDKPVGYSMTFRLPERFHLHVGEAIQFDKRPPMLMVMKQSHGIIASEYRLVCSKKGVHPPKMRTIAAVNW